MNGNLNGTHTAKPNFIVKNPSTFLLGKKENFKNGFFPSDSSSPQLLPRESNTMFESAVPSLPSDLGPSDPFCRHS